MWLRTLNKPDRVSSFPVIENHQIEINQYNAVLSRFCVVKQHYFVISISFWSFFSSNYAPNLPFGSCLKMMHSLPSPSTHLYVHRENEVSSTIQIGVNIVFRCQTHIATFLMIYCIKEFDFSTFWYQ